MEDKILLRQLQESRICARRASAFPCDMRSTHLIDAKIVQLADNTEIHYRAFGRYLRGEFRHQVS